MKPLGRRRCQLFHFGCDQLAARAVHVRGMLSGMAQFGRLTMKSEIKGWNDVSKKTFVLRTMLELANQFHDQHKRCDAVRGPYDTPFASCRICADVRVALDILKGPNAS